MVESYHVDSDHYENYGYLTGGYSNNKFDVDITYETGRDAVTGVTNQETVGTSATVSSFSYTYNDLGQRGALGYSGSAFSAAGGFDYHYNSNGELGAADFTGSATTLNRSSTYDGIGNRDWYAWGGADEGEAPEPADPKPSGSSSRDCTVNTRMLPRGL